ncbi:hypothetical protein TNCV_3003861, partial [Trichonephila clavipes]
PNYGRQIRIGFVQSSIAIIDADADDENEMNNAAPVLTSSEMRNAKKTTRGRLDGLRNFEPWTSERTTPVCGSLVVLSSNSLHASPDPILRPLSYRGLTKDSKRYGKEKRLLGLVVRDSRPEGQGSMPDVTKHPPVHMEYVLDESMGPKSLVGGRSRIYGCRRLENISLPSSSIPKVWRGR